MTTIESTKDQTAENTTYEQRLLKGMAVACFLFPLLFLVSAVYFLTGTREFIGDPVFQWVSNHDVGQYRFSYWAWIAMIPAMVGITRMLQHQKSRLAFWGVIFAFIGGVHQVSADGAELFRSQLRQAGYEIYWNTLSPTPADFIGLLIVLWMVGMIVLGIASWRTRVLPGWVGGLIALGALTFFLYQGPGAVIDVLPLIAYQIAAVCFLLAFPVVGWRLWRWEAANSTT